MSSPEERQRALRQILDERILVLDGGMGTMIHRVPLSVEVDYEGHENCPEILTVTRPDVIENVHRYYLDAGADVIETNTFGGTGIALADNNLQARVYELNLRAAQMARAKWRTNFRRQTALRGRLDGADQQRHQHHRLGHLRRHAGRLLQAGQGADGRRRGLFCWWRRPSIRAA
jgi:methionine synthase I (cobalamin-dependent)